MEQMNIMLEPLRQMFGIIVDFLPHLLVAVVILIVGWMLAKFLKFAVVRGLRGINIHVLADRAGMDGFLKRGGIRSDTVTVIGLLMYWLVILAALMVAFNSLGLAYVTDLVGRVLLFLPRVIVAILIIAFGAYFARFLASSITAYGRNVGIQDADVLGRFAMYAVMAFVVVIALDQVNIGGDIVRLTFLIVLSGVVLAAAIAFGLGGQKWAANTIERMSSGRKPKS